MDAITEAQNIPFFHIQALSQIDSAAGCLCAQISRGDVAANDNHKETDKAMASDLAKTSPNTQPIAGSRSGRLLGFVDNIPANHHIPPQW